MTTEAILLCIACQFLIIVGQLFLKRGAVPVAGQACVFPLAIGIGCMTIWFFLWLGLMAKWDLSKLFPFEGLNPVLLAIAAAFILKEKLPFYAWVGIGLICGGVALVAAN